ncbi:MAG: hypothetical protein ATN35_12710 [Epulopiscium sp. Nele67-Bin004]|nr:MAG: hypothetical protein ATN35_12710 [Epulopiscium sp. Nele67-Bin004]
MKIMNKPTTDVYSMQAWATQKDATLEFIYNALDYWNIATAKGVDPLIAYVQYAVETGYGKFTGVLSGEYNNPCGLKIPEGGDCMIASSHKKFESWKEGITAHIDHLALYAGADGYPMAKNDTPDPRHFSYLLGKGTTLAEMAAQWAVDTNYVALLSRLAEELLEATQVRAELAAQAENKDTWCVNGKPVADVEVIKLDIEINGDLRQVEAIVKNNHNYIKLRDITDDKIKVDYFDGQIYLSSVG